MQELEEKSNIKFSYEGIKEGRRWDRIRFKIYKNTPKIHEIDEKAEMIEKAARERQLEIPYDIMPEIYDTYVGNNDLSKEDVDILLRTAHYDVDKVKRAIELAETMEIHGLPIESLESIYTAEELIKAYADFKLERPIETFEEN